MQALFGILQVLIMSYTFGAYWGNLICAFLAKHLFREKGKTYSRAYFLSDDHEFDSSYRRVPEDAVYIEEWTNDQGVKKCYVQYEGEILLDHASPFELRARCPWIWVGDKDTEIDLTRTFHKFLVPGNCIEIDLVTKLIHLTPTSNLIYIDAKTFEERKFPGDGIVIEEDV